MSDTTLSRQKTAGDNCAGGAKQAATNLGSLHLPSLQQLFFLAGSPTCIDGTIAAVRNTGHRSSPLL